MSRFATVFSVSVVLVLLQTGVSAAKPPAAVQKWLESEVGKWQVKGGVDPGAVGHHSSQLLKEGNVLLTRGTTGAGDEFVAVEAWEPDKRKLVIRFYLSNGAFLTREQNVQGNTLTGSVTGVDAEGKPFSGKFVSERKADGSVESSYEGTYAGEDISAKWTSTKTGS